MKKINLILMLFISIFCYGQTDTTSFIIKESTLLPEFSLNISSFGTIWSDSIGQVAYLKDDSAWIEDNLRLLRLTKKISEDSYNQYKWLHEKFVAANDILLYLKVDGTIINKRKFKKAVKEYHKIMEDWNNPNYCK